MDGPKRYINEGGIHGRTHLHFAAENNLLSMCKMLLKSANEVDPQDDNGNTPFHLAASNGHLEVCELLIDYNINVENFQSQIPFHMAAINGHLEVCNLIIEDDPVGHLNLLGYGDCKHSFYWAAAKGLFGVCKLFLEKLQEKNPANDLGYSLLHWAAQNGHLEICQYIIENANDKNPADLLGETPLHLAAEKGQLEVCKLIADNITEEESNNYVGQIMKLLETYLLSKKIKLE